MGLLSLLHGSAQLIQFQRATTAADALVLAVTSDRGVAPVIAQHDIVDFVVRTDGDNMVTVSIVRNGVAATAIAHRHTLTNEQ